MKTSVYFKSVKEAGKEGLSSVCFRVRDKEIDIKVVAKFWDEDALCYRRNNTVPKEERKRIPAQIAAVTERATAIFGRNNPAPLLVYFERRFKLSLPRKPVLGII